MRVCHCRSERDLLREELEGAGVRIRQLLTEVSDLEASAQDQAASAFHNASNLEEALSDERKRRTEVESELRHVQEVCSCDKVLERLYAVFIALK